MLFYILQTLFFQIIFLIVYDLLHKKDTFFTINRYYLLVSSALSLVLPFAKINDFGKDGASQHIIELPAAIVGTGYNPISSSKILSDNLSQSSTLLDTGAIILLIYLIGTVYLSFLFAKRITAIYRLKSTTKTAETYSYQVYCIPNSRSAFSFWNMVFIGDLFSKKERQQILAHEFVHLREKHTLDLLWFELLKIVFWFNPLIHLYYNRILLLHEYISDAIAVNELGKQTYFQQLLNAHFETKDVAFTHNFFNNHILKKRITMLQKSNSIARSKLKYLIIFPVLLGSLTLTSFIPSPFFRQISISKNTEELKLSLLNIGNDPTEDENLIQTKTETFESVGLIKNHPQAVKVLPSKTSMEPILHEIQLKKADSVTKDIPFAKIEKLPTTKTCQWIDDRTKQKECVSNEIKDHVNAYFNVEAVSKYARPGINRIYVRFKINTQGKIVDVQSRGSAPELEKEAVRVVNSIPQMIPGEHDGEKVNVLYSLPIIFEKATGINEANATNQIENTSILIEKLNDNSIEKGYYLITNIFKSETYLKKGMKKLKEKNLNPRVFRNPKDTYYYLYLEKFDNPIEAKKSLLSNHDGKYKDDLYILKIE